MAAWLVMPSSTQNAVADGETRTLHLYHTHTGETIDATFRLDGRYDPEVLRQLNHFLRDWRNNDEISMDPRLFDAIWEAYRTAGNTDRIQIYSSYRSPETNAMLRRRSKAVAEHSQHMLGKAMDTTVPGFPMERIREAGMKLQHGGVGWYPSANFVHIDVGGVRSWPRMSYDQLSQLFPDGKTVHIASNGQTLPGYEQARLELAQRGQTELPPSQESGGLFAWLFGGSGGGSGTAHEDEEDRRVAVASAAPPARAVAPPQVQAQPEPQPVPVQAQAPAEPPPQPAAIAYAAPEAQPVDTPSKVIGADGLTPQAQPAQVASLEPAPGPVADAGPIQSPTPVATAPEATMPETAAPKAAMRDAPMPPRRPADLVAAPEIPLPPIRPSIVAAIAEAPLRTAEAEQSTPQTDAPRSERAIVAQPASVALPAIIARGGGASPVEALAFAGDHVAAAEPRIAMEPVQGLARFALRASARQRRVATGISTVARSMPLETPSVATEVASGTVVGPHLTGLRRAAHQLADNAAL